MTKRSGKKTTAESPPEPELLEAPAAALDPVMSVATFLDTTKLKRAHADLIRSLCGAEKHTLAGWRERLDRILTTRIGGNP